MPEPTVGGSGLPPESPDKAKTVRRPFAARRPRPWSVLAATFAENVHEAFRLQSPFCRSPEAALMFTGIVQATGTVAGIERRGGDMRITIRAPEWDHAEVLSGDSIAVSGCCLTALATGGDALAFDVSNETLSLTTLGDLHEGDRVNLEPALRLSDRLGGHLVSGHIDGVGTIAAIEPDARSQRWRIEAPRGLMRYIAAKGSICVDGVSLTVNDVEGNRFGVNLIPHTVAVTSFRDRGVGDRVNLEVDLLARHLERLMQQPEH
jgi:riboflavin synthase